MRPGDIYFATNVYGPDPHRVVVVSRRELNGGKYVVVVPFTSKKFEERKDLPQCVPFLAGEQEGLTENCVARCDQISTIDQVEVDFTSGRLGVIDEERMRGIIRSLGYVLEAECEPE